MMKSIKGILCLFLVFFLSACAGNTETESTEKESAGETMETMLTPGMEITFGSYPQSDNEAEPIVWIVLESDEEKALLLAKECLDARPFNDKDDTAVWESCSLREWLNNEFLLTAFSPEEISAILESDLENGDDLNYGTPAGADTKDRIFLLSGKEVQTFLASEEARTVKASAYAVSEGAYTNDAGSCAWWLRSPGTETGSPAYIASQGNFGNRAHTSDETIIGVRPALRIKVSYWPKP